MMTTFRPPYDKPTSCFGDICFVLKPRGQKQQVRVLKEAPKCSYLSYQNCSCSFYWLTTLHGYVSP